MLEFFLQEIIRERAAGIQGAALLNIDLYTCEIDERVIVESCCLENTDAANTIDTRIGVVSGGIFYPHKTNAAVAAGASLEIDRRLIVGPRETLRVEITPSGANTDYIASMTGMKVLTDSSSPYYRPKEEKDKDKVKE